MPKTGAYGRDTDGDHHDKVAGLSLKQWTLVVVTALVIVTLVVALDTVRGDEPPASPQAEDTPTGNQVDDRGPGPVPSGSYDDLPQGELPPGGPVTHESSGTYRTIGQPGPRVGEGEELFRYVIEVEDTIDTASIGGDDAFAAMVDATLANPKGWIGDPRFAFQHIDSADLKPGEEPDLRIQLSTQNTTHEVCGNEFRLETSCFYGEGNRVVLNESRWIRGATTYDGDLGGYRQYLVNHEVGHGIGFAQHQPCEDDGGLAPVMMQQTLSLNNGVLKDISSESIYDDADKTCRPNPWAFPVSHNGD